MGKQFIQYYDQRSFERFLNEYLEKNNVKVSSITPVVGTHTGSLITEGFYVLFEKMD